MVNVFSTFLRIRFSCPAPKWEKIGVIKWTASTAQGPKQDKVKGPGLTVNMRYGFVSVGALVVNLVPSWWAVSTIATQFWKCFDNELSKKMLFTVYSSNTYGNRSSRHDTSTGVLIRQWALIRIKCPTFVETHKSLDMPLMQLKDEKFCSVSCFNRDRYCQSVYSNALEFCPYAFFDRLKFPQCERYWRPELE